jgi:hypothetical protein
MTFEFEQHLCQNQSIFQRTRVKCYFKILKLVFKEIYMIATYYKILRNSNSNVMEFEVSRNSKYVSKSQISKVFYHM